MSQTYVPVAAASAVIDEEEPFGMEFLPAAVMRNVNTGFAKDAAQVAFGAGCSVPEEGFRLCESCGVALLPGRAFDDLTLQPRTWRPSDRHDTAPLFPATSSGRKSVSEHGGQAVSPRSVHKMVEQVMRAAGIDFKKISPHSLRHTFAMAFLAQNPGDIRALRKILGHSSIVTTQRYVDHLATADLAAKMPALPTPARPSWCLDDEST